MLKAQLQTMTNFTESVLSTVYWSLGSIFGFLILFVGYGWYSNRKVHDKEIELIRESLLNELATFKASAKTEFSEEIEHQRAGLDDLVSKKSEASLETIRKGVATLRKYHKQLRDAFALHKAEAEVRYWEQREVPANVYHSLLDVITAAKEDGESDWVIDGALEQMREIASKHRNSIDAAIIADSVELVDSLVSRHQVNVEALKRALSA